MLQELSSENQILNIQSQDLIQRMIDVVKEHLQKLALRIKNKQLVCHFKIGCVSLDPKDSDTLKFIRSLKSNSIDWSNICDYMDNKEFLELTKRVSPGG